MARGEVLLLTGSPWLSLGFTWPRHWQVRGETLEVFVWKVGPNC